MVELSREVVSDSGNSDSDSSVQSPKSPLLLKSAKKVQDKKSAPADGVKASKGKPTETIPDSESESQSQSNSDDATSDSSSENDEESIEDQTTETPSSSKAKGKRPVTQFQPPRGFKEVTSSAPSADLLKSFNNLSEKQIWHITAPASVPITTIREITYDAVVRGQPILTSGDISYGLQEDKREWANSKKRFLIPEKETSQVRDSVGVSKTFHLAEISQSQITASEFQEDDVADQPRRKLPKKMKMRFRPFGTVDDGPETIGSSSDESDREIPGFKVPRGAEKELKKKKKQDNKSKTSKKTVSEDDRMDIDEVVAAKADEERGRKKEGHKKSSKGETSPERKARKAEKKRKRLEK